MADRILSRQAASALGENSLSSDELRTEIEGFDDVTLFESQQESHAVDDSTEFSPVNDTTDIFGTLGRSNFS